MGDIRRTRKKYSTPSHPWNKERIQVEKKYKQQYGLRNKKEIWKAESILKGIKDQIKSFPSLPPERVEVLESQLRNRLLRLGLIKQDTNLGDVLGMDANSILERRLQSLLLSKGLARSAKQARQMIVHEHVLVGGRVVNAPSYLVPKDEESSIQFRTNSPFFSESHPEREEKERPVMDKKPKQSAPNEEPELVELKEEDKNLE